MTKELAVMPVRSDVWQSVGCWHFHARAIEAAKGYVALIKPDERLLEVKVCCDQQC